MKFNQLPIIRQLILAGDLGKRSVDNHNYMSHRNFTSAQDLPPGDYAESKETCLKYGINIDEYLDRYSGVRVFNGPSVNWSANTELSVKFTIAPIAAVAHAFLEIQVRVDNTEAEAESVIDGIHNIVTATIKNRDDLTVLKDWFSSHDIEPRINDAVVNMISSFEEALEQADAITDVDWSILSPRVDLMPIQRALSNIVYTGRRQRNECDDESDLDDFSIYGDYHNNIVVENNSTRPRFTIRVNLTPMIFKAKDELTVTGTVNGTDYPNPVKMPISLDITPIEYIDTVISAINELGKGDEITTNNLKPLKVHFIKYLTSAKPAITHKVEEAQAVRTKSLQNIPF